MRRPFQQLVVLAATLLSWSVAGYEYHHHHHAPGSWPTVPSPSDENQTNTSAGEPGLPAEAKQKTEEHEQEQEHKTGTESKKKSQKSSPEAKFSDYTEYGVRLPRERSFKTLTHVMDTPLDKTCLVSSDCTRKCVESCELALVDHKCSVASKCANTCRLKDCSSAVPHHPAGSNCQYLCDGACVSECRSKEEKSTRSSFERCLTKKEEPCVKECLDAGEHSPQVCKKKCETRARSACTASATSSCLAACGRHVCTSEGRCKCPFFLRGNRMCTAYSWMRNVVVDHIKYCFQSPFEKRFETTKFGDHHAPSISPGFFYEPVRNMDPAIEANQQREVKDGNGEPEKSKNSLVPAPDLADLADFSTCAVVGGSGSLTGKGLGPEIDNHTAVIRFNDAPTSGYEADVGRRTTLRVQNNMYCGFCEAKDEILFPYTISTVENFCYPRMNRPTCQVYKASNELRNFVTRFFEPFLQQFAEDQFWVYDHSAVLKGIGADDFGMEPMGEVPKYKAQFDDDEENSREDGANDKRRRLTGDKVAVTQQYNGQEVPLKDISAGLTGVLMAMHMCHKVDVYGFNNADEGYYYPKIKRPDREWGMIHYWELERICLDAYSKYVSGVQFH